MPGDDLDFGAESLNKVRKDKNARLKMLAGLGIAAVVGGFLIVVILLATGGKLTWGEGLGRELRYGVNYRLFYASSVTKEEAKKLADYLKRTPLLEAPNTHVTRSGETYVVSFFVYEDDAKDADVLETLETARREMQAKVFPGSKVEFHLCDPIIGDGRHSFVVYRKLESD
ncbi:MAG: hypothetical protein AB7K24_07085 [Gemmataceae bacterium]